MPHVFSTQVVTQRPVAAGHFEMVLAGRPAFDDAVPGQFIAVRAAAADSWDPLLRRPFSLYRRLPNGDYSIVYRVAGRGTAALSRLQPGDAIDVVGPLGNGFTPPARGERVVLVGGGVGVPPLLFFAQRYAPLAGGMTALLGFQTASVAFGHDAFERLGVTVRLATADGSLGTRGLVTDLLEPLLADRACDTVCACGPRPMLVAVARLLQRYALAGQLAFEEAMACGIGACLSCVLPVRTERGVAYARVCHEGPVFPSEAVIVDA